MAVLQVKDLTKVFSGARRWFGANKPPFTAVDAISFCVDEGEILGFLGPNGAGKTTTVHMLLSTIRPSSGTIMYFGLEFDEHRSEILQRVGFASTYAKLPPRMTILANLDMYARLYGLSSHERPKRIEHCLRFFDMWSRRDQEVGELSAGETTRVMLAKAFVADPKIVILDEPTASLDPDVADEVRHFILRQRAEQGTSFLITSHNMDEVTQLCDRVLILKNGKIIANNTPDELARSISTARVVLTMGDQVELGAAYAQEQGLFCKDEGSLLHIELDEHAIASFLIGLANKGLNYTQISVEKPTLEDYFLQMSRS